MLTKKQIHIETSTNQILGLIIGWCVVYFFFPLIQHLPMEQMATISSIVFFCMSYIRIYITRRFFNYYFYKDTN